MNLKSSARSTIYGVYSCTSLPSEEALRTWVLATGGDEDTVARFVAWRARVAVELGREDSRDDGEDDVAEEAGAAAPSVTATNARRRRREVVIAAVATLTTAAVCIPVTAAISNRPHHPPVTTPTVATGDDPQQCTSDATLANPEVTTPPMALKIIFSPRCSAVWGKVERLDAQGFGNSITVTVYREGRSPTGDGALSITERNVGNAYTPMIVRRSPAEHICVTASMTLDNGARTIHAPYPQCT